MNRLALLACVALAGCIHPRILEDGVPNDDAVDAVADEVARERELPFSRDVPVEVKTAAELGDELRAYYEKNKDALAIEDAFYKRLGVLRADQSLATTYTKFYVSFVGGIYDRTGDGKMILVRDYAWWSKVQQDMIGWVTGRDWAYELFLAHELVHALQDQHVDLDYVLADAQDAYDGDRVLVRKTLLESEAATLGMAHFFGMDLRGRMERRAFFAYLRFNNLLNGPLMAALSGRTPSFFSKQTFGQYELGLDRIEEMLDEGGWDEVSRSWLRPPGDPRGLPESTEQLLHDDKRLDPPIRIARLARPPTSIGATDVLLTSTFGELLWRLYLETFLLDVDAAIAAAGWGGDRYEYVRAPHGDVLCWRTVWDTDEDAREFADAWARALVARHGDAATELAVADAGVRAWSTPPLPAVDDTADAAEKTAPRRDVAAVLVRGRRVVLVDGAPPDAWRPLLDELAAATAETPLVDPPGRAAAAAALEESIAQAPDPGPRTPTVLERLVLPARTMSFRLGASWRFRDDVPDAFVLPDAELRWGVRRGLEWTLPLNLSTRTTSALGLTSTTAGLLGLGYSSAQGFFGAGLFGVLHAVPLGERIAVIGQVQARADAYSTGSSWLTTITTVGASINPWQPLVLTAGAGWEETYVDVFDAAFAGGPLQRAERGHVVLGSALRRGLVNAPLVEIEVSDMLHLYESSRLVLDLRRGGTLVRHEHAVGVLLYF